MTCSIDRVKLELLVRMPPSTPEAIITGLRSEYARIPQHTARLFAVHRNKDAGLRAPMPSGQNVYVQTSPPLKPGLACPVDCRHEKFRLRLLCFCVDRQYE